MNASVKTPHNYRYRAAGTKASVFYHKQTKLFFGQKLNKNIYFHLINPYPLSDLG